jgi:hypothetical protein
MPEDPIADVAHIRASGAHVLILLCFETADDGSDGRLPRALGACLLADDATLDVPNDCRIIEERPVGREQVSLGALSGDLGSTHEPLEVGLRRLPGRLCAPKFDL